MKRVERLLAMLVVLHTKKLVTVDYLARTFRVSTRTAYRDIKALSGLQFTVGYEQSKGYVVIKAYSGASGPYSMKLLPAAVKNESMLRLLVNGK